MSQPSASSFSFDVQVVLRALSRAWAKTGNRIAARIAMMAITTSSSIRVKPRRHVRGPIGFSPFETLLFSAWGISSPGIVLGRKRDRLRAMNEGGGDTQSG